MLLKSSQQAREFGAKVAEELSRSGSEAGLNLLNEILCERTPFHLLDHVGAAIHQAGQDKANQLLDMIASQRREGGWVVIASALRERLPEELPETLEACRKYIIQADIWYGCDIFGERVPGPALLSYFQPALDQLAGWRMDANRWVRRSLGVAIHFWAKRTRGKSQFEPQANQLLDFLSPAFEDKNMDAAKGIGWALKTIGRHYPKIAGAWLEEQLLERKRKPAAIVKRKALLYLPAEIKRKFEG